MWLLLLILIINLIGAWLAWFLMKNYTHWNGIFIFPALVNLLLAREVSTLKIIFAAIGFAILFPAYLFAHFLVLLLLIIVAFVMVLVLDIIDAIKNRKKK